MLLKSLSKEVVLIESTANLRNPNSIVVQT